VRAALVLIEMLIGKGRWLRMRMRMTLSEDVAEMGRGENQQRVEGFLIQRIANQSEETPSTAELIVSPERTFGQ
jgi:hypothetical protein